MDTEKALPLKKKALNRYSLFQVQRTLIVFIAISIIAGSIYYCLSCAASEMIQGFERASEGSDESEENHDRREPSYLIDWGTEDEIVMDNTFYTRNIHLQRKCRELNVQKKSDFGELIMNRERYLIYCNVFGAASSIWLLYFNLLDKSSGDYLSKNRTSEELLSLLRERNVTISPTEFTWESVYYLSFIVVRHPYDRLVDTYMEQFIFNSHRKWFKIIGEEIISNTRVENEVERDRFGRLRKFEYPPTFEEFVRFILCQWRNNRTADEHWAPAATLCNPCQVNFTLILKFETLEDEQVYLEKRSGFDRLKKPVERVTEKPVLDDTIRDSTKKFFSQLSKQQIHELYEYFEEDFELFGYSAGREYLDLGREVHSSPPCLAMPHD